MSNHHNQNDSDFSAISGWLSEIDRLQALPNGDAEGRLSSLRGQPPPYFAEILARRVVGLIKETRALKDAIKALEG